MEEVFPVLAGIVVGLGTCGARSWLKLLLIGGFGLAFGALAAWISGELAVSVVYLLIDTAQVIAAAVMTRWLVTVWLRRRQRATPR